MNLMKRTGKNQNRARKVQEENLPGHSVRGGQLKRQLGEDTTKILEQHNEFIDDVENRLTSCRPFICITTL